MRYNSFILGGDESGMDAVQKSLEYIESHIRNRRLVLAGGEFAAGYCVEMYDVPDKYPNGTQDENYHSEIWIPIKKK